LQTKGWRVLLAHPERSESVPLDMLDRLCVRGVRMQLELGSFVGLFGKAVEERATRMLEDGMGHVLATDMHRPEEAEAWLGGALRAVEKAFGRAALEWGAAANPQLILDDASPDDLQPILVAS